MGMLYRARRQYRTNDAHEPSSALRRSRPRRERYGFNRPPLPEAWFPFRSVARGPFETIPLRVQLPWARL